jgi:pheromone shutdown protein TraB
MLSLLESIFHGILDLPYLVINLFIEAFNGWILILAGILSGILAILPGFPEVPTLGSEVLGGVAWFLPIAPMLAIFATFVTAWVVWMGFSVILRWVRALG